MFLPDENLRHGRRTERHLFDDRKDPWLVVVVSVCYDAQVDLVWVGICFVYRGECEEARGGDVRRVGPEDHKK